MIEVVFGSSIEGSMKIAKDTAPPIGGGDGPMVIVTEKHVSFLTLRRLQKQAEKQRKALEKAVPLSGSRQDILFFPLALSVGDICEQGIGPGRETAIRKLTGAEWEPALEEDLLRARENLQTLVERAKTGEAIRVWTSHNPDEACGIYWLAEQLRPIGFDKVNVTAVILPTHEEREDGTIVAHVGWGDAAPEDLGRMAELGKPLSPGILRMLANSWKQLQEENAPLRAVMNGKLSSAGEDLYDFYILREIDRFQGDFPEPQLIGNVLGRYSLGIGDCWVALRIEDFIRRGLLISVTQPEPGSLYRGRILRKPE